MTVVGWALLAAALLCLPVPEPARQRAAVLAARGRLAAVADAGVRRLAVPRIDALAFAGCGGVSVGVGLAGGIALAGAAAIASATVVRLLVAARMRRAGMRAQTELLAGFRLVAAELEAGSRPHAALAAAAAVDSGHREQLLAAARALHEGRDPPLDDPELRPLAGAVALAGHSGAPLAAVVRRVADDCAARVASRRAVSAATAGARSSAALLAGLPVLGLLLGAAMQAHPLSVLLGTPAGRIVCLAGVALDAAGLAWTQRLAARAERS